MCVSDVSRWLAIAAYQCRINGVSVGSVDFRVRYFNLPGIAEVEATLKDEPPQAYENHIGEMVSWPLVKIFDIQGLLPAKSGDEIIGFIAQPDELAALGGADCGA
jgi:hypothetical protein